MNTHTNYHLNPYVSYHNQEYIVVLTPNAVVNPFTMMIKLRCTSVTITTVLTSL